MRNSLFLLMVTIVTVPLSLTHMNRSLGIPVEVFGGERNKETKGKYYVCLISLP